MSGDGMDETTVSLIGVSPLIFKQYNWRIIMSEMMKLVLNIEDELTQTKGLLRCLIDAQFGLARDHPDVEDLYWLTSDIRERLGKSLNEIRKVIELKDEMTSPEEIIREKEKDLEENKAELEITRKKEKLLTKKVELLEDNLGLKKILSQAWKTGKIKKHTKA